MLLPVGLINAVPPGALCLWAILKQATANGERPTQADLAAKCGIRVRQLRKLTRDLEAVGALVTRQAGDGRPAEYTLHDLPGESINVPQKLEAAAPGTLRVGIAIMRATINGKPQVTQQEIGALAGVSTRTVRRHIKHLVQAGWLTVEQGGMCEPSLYFANGTRRA